MRLNLINQIQRKELVLFFASPIGYLFLGAYLAATLFIFFWVESFFARNIADVRPMFEWLPVLLIFLSAAVTMRMWSEERRSGTLEFIATVPVSTWEFVVGKFLACWVLLLIALVLTLPLPLSVALIGAIDWGPVLAGYLAAMLLGGAYLCVGLFVSARTDSQIVSLIVTSLISGAFYLLGSPAIAGFFGGPMQELLTAVGSGARFDSITRGVIDIRDLYFYLSIGLSFLALNVYALERERWAADGDRARHRAWGMGTGLLVANLLLANVWLAGVNVLRVDATEGKIYSISDATHGYLGQLREPLLIRGYFSAKTHPYLAPLVPRMKDLLREYEVAGGGRVRVEIIDPADDPEAEHDANTKYGIRSVPFQVADRHQASLVNSYFDVLIQYGDEYEVLGFRDLIEVKVEGETQMDVQLTNPEFDITRSIKKVMYGFQGGSSVFANIAEPVEFVGYISADETLPEPLSVLKGELRGVLDELGLESGSILSSQIVDPGAGDGQVALDIAEQYGFQPMAASLFDDSRFYFYLVLRNDEIAVQIPLPESLSAQNLKREIEEGLKRFASGLLKSVVLSTPESPPPYMQQQGQPPGNQFTQLQDFLTSDFDLSVDRLESGVVPSDADIVVVADPNNFNEKQVFALDQFLMKGGTVVLATGAFASQATPASLSAVPRQSGLTDWLGHHGVVVGEAMVMDPQNSAFPVPVTRQAGGFSFQDLVLLDYPYFIDVRGDGLNDESPIVAGLPQITMSWASPLKVAENEQVNSTVLLSSSEGSWLSSDTDVMPQFDEQGGSAFTPEGDQAVHPLAVALQGRFNSYFAGQDSPLLMVEESEAVQDEEAATEQEGNELGIVSSVIEHSPESARLLVFGSNDFLADQTLSMVGAAEGARYGNSVQMMVNVVDWALEDASLTGIRARGNFNRTLPGLTEPEQNFIEYSNYILAAFGIGVVMLIFRRRGRREAQVYRTWLGSRVGGQA